MPILPHLRFRTSLMEKLTTSIQVGFYHQTYQPQWVVNPEAVHALEQLQKNDQLFQNISQPDCGPEDWNRVGIDLAQLWRVQQLAGVAPRQPGRGTKGFSKKGELYSLLCAYLDEPAYRAVENTSKSWKLLKNYTWEHWLCLVQDIINTPNELIKIVDNLIQLAQTKQNKIPVQTYFKKAFVNKIRENLEKFGISRASDWRLLCMAKESELRQALKKQGISDLLIERYIFAWDYFKSVYEENRVNHPRRKKGDRWLNPQIEDYAKVAQSYNQEKELIGVPLSVFQDCSKTPEQIEQWMQESVQALRKSALIDEVNINSADLLDKLKVHRSVMPPSDGANPSDLWGNVQAILTQPLQEINSRLTEAIAQGEKPAYVAKILPLRYGIGLSQQEVGQIFGVHQSQISRRESDYLESLLSWFCQWLADKKGMGLERVYHDLEQWLSGGDFAPQLSPNIQEILTATLAKSVGKSECSLLKKHYQKHKSIPQLAKEHQLKLKEVEQALDRAKDPLRRVLCIGFWVETSTPKLLQQSYQDSLSSPTPLSDKILEGVEQLTEEQQKLLRYVYGTRFSQEEIAQKLHCSPDALKRQLSASLEDLQIILHLKLTELVTTTVKRCLKCHYQTQVLPRFPAQYPEEYQLLTWTYQHRWTPQKIAKHRGSIGYSVTVDEVVNQLSQAEGLFLEDIQSWCQQTLEVSLGEGALEKVLKKWF
ncbi:MAG: sigma factor-like helix-turn-helix DNA-binding protein [Chroococcales cyanobacterium]